MAAGYVGIDEVAPKADCYPGTQTDASNILTHPGGVDCQVTTGRQKPAVHRLIPVSIRRSADLAVRVCVRLGIHPDVVSYMSVVVAAGAAICFWNASSYPVLLAIVPVFLYVRLWLNMLDGMVARAAGYTGWHGVILNELPDRVSDVVVFIGIAHSGLCAVPSGYCAAILAVLTAYTRILGQSLGAPAEFAGLMSKPLRMVACHVGAWATFGLLWWQDGSIQYASLTVLDLTCLIVVLGCIETICVRLSHIAASLQRREV